jgi:RES domain-containing protein
VRLTGRVFRAHNPRWAFDPLSGAGARLHGGRFNSKGMPALYASQRIETAWLEAQQGFAFKAQPMTLCAYEVDCADIIDLTQGAELVRLGIDAADLSCGWEDHASRGQVPPTWSLAQRLLADGAAGALVPSFAPGTTGADINVVFWRWSDTPPHRISVIDDFGRLPRDDRSWR